jgi:hypothetical protein
MVLLSLFLLGGCATGKYVPKANEELYGTWTNNSTFPQRVVINPGEYRHYGLISDPNPEEEGTEHIDTKWTDSEGNIWYRTFGTVTTGAWKGHNFQALTKLSKSGTVLESEAYSFLGDFSPSYYPTKINPQGMLYGLYYRAEK